MTVWRIVKTLRVLSVVVIFVLASMITFGSRIYQEIALESAYHREFGPDWKQRYETRFGKDPLSQAHGNIAFGIGGLAVILTIIWFIYRELSARDRLSQSSSRRRRR